MSQLWSRTSILPFPCALALARCGLGCVRTSTSPSSDRRSRFNLKIYDARARFGWYRLIVPWQLSHRPSGSSGPTRCREQSSHTNHNRTPPSTIVIFARHLPTEHLHAAHHEACREKTEAYTVKVMQQASRLAGAVVGAALVST